MNKIKMIVGLANPKKEYHKTRHNVGSWCVYTLLESCSKHLKKEKKFFGFTSFLNIKSNDFRVLVPNIFMNINGQSVFKMASFYNIDLSEILIFHDDLDLNPGVFKLKYGHGHSGHNGLRSVISTFNSKKINFYRFRIGIGRPVNQNQISSFVLSHPTSTENILIKTSILCVIKKLLHYFDSIK